MPKDDSMKISVITLWRNSCNYIKNTFFDNMAFDTSDNYWIARYKGGGNSGAGSYNALAEFKGEIINSFVMKNNINSVIEFGCGDGNQLKYLNLNSYVGYDVSPDAIKQCSVIFKDDNNKQFKLLKNYENTIADLTLSLDVIYHLIEDDIYNDYMLKLFESSHRYVIIYSSNNDKKEFNSPHVKNRAFSKWIKATKPEYKLIQHIPNKFPFNGDELNTSFADFYIFELTA